MNHEKSHHRQNPQFEIRTCAIHEILVLGKAILNTPSCRLGSEIGSYANL